MILKDFDFILPHNLISQKPVYPRDMARMMVIDKENEEIRNNHFYDLPDFLNRGDVLVLNNSRVIPARLLGKLKDGKEIEVFVLELRMKTPVLIKPAKKVGLKEEIFFSDNFKGLLKKTEEGFEIRFNKKGKELKKYIDSLGTVPLPPYILKERHEKLAEEKDKEDYQTVYAKKEGSVASPTAGLHFTKDLLEKIKEKGVLVLEVTLHVGLGTFEPIRSDEFENHKMHSERYVIDKKTVAELNKAKKEKRRIIAVGTTSTRVLETSFKKGKFNEGAGKTDIFIYPGYEFKAVDALITNFHLPKSSLLLLVSAFTGINLTRKAYKKAIKEEYRFYSYGDGMIIF